MISSILDAAGAGPTSRLLEVGCAAGYLAQGLAPRVGSYVGVDLAREAVATARRLRLPNARFKVADGSDLPFSDDSFDAAICYDVLTNFPDFAPVAGIVAEMIRTTRPGGRVLMGSVPDAALEAPFIEAVTRVQRELQETQGPLLQPQLHPVRRGWWRRWLGRDDAEQPPGERGAVACYYFDRKPFLELGKRLGVEAEVVPVHSLNPYADYRFNVVYAKPQRL
jgi:SAM-dependent methyltransferase